VVEQFNAAGTVTLGKLNCDEFAMGSGNENSFYGAVKNPGTRPPSPAAPRAARPPPWPRAWHRPPPPPTPAARSASRPLCGTGIKPTYGSVSRYGMIAFASSLDQGGPIAKTAEDCGLLLNAMAGFDERDSTSLQRPKEDFTRSLNQGLQGLRIGVPKEFFGAGLAADVEAAVRAALAEFEKLGATWSISRCPRPSCPFPCTT
jgi:aspartyl-tRNA(Asn)/glutamyl-tRNA(Gln) amidotransferase subunit A